MVKPYMVARIAPPLATGDFLTYSATKQLAVYCSLFAGPAEVASALASNDARVHEQHVAGHGAVECVAGADDEC